MSLINDALKRAKEAQRRASPPPSSPMQFRPVEPAQQARHGVGLMLPAILAGAALLALFCAWQWAQRRPPAEPREVRALTRPGAPATVTPQSVALSPTETATTAQPSPPAELPFQPDAIMEVANLLPATDPSPSSTPPLAREQANDASDSVVVASPPPPKPAPLRLQAIVFNPKRPSVLINGKTLFVGERVGDARVVAIDQESATLVSAGKTNILTLGE